MQIARRISTWAGSSEPAPAYWGLCFTAEEAGATIRLARNGTSTALVVELEYSRDGKIWTPYTIGEMITLTATGDRVYFAAKEDGNAGIAVSTTNYHYFEMRGSIAASGDISSLLNRNSSVAALTTNFIFANLFQSCTSLVSAPELPAQTLSGNCYRYMFSGCTSLVSAPELPAQTLSGNCYYSMFSGCTSLVSAPELLAQTLASNCYRQMFSGCTSLVSAPELLAQTLANNCYQQMFSGCTSLSDIKAHFIAWGTQTSNWVNGVAALGLFRCPDALPHTASDFTTSKIPPGWTVETF